MGVALLNLDQMATFPVRKALKFTRQKLLLKQRSFKKFPDFERASNAKQPLSRCLQVSHLRGYYGPCKSPMTFHVNLSFFKIHLNRQDTQESFRRLCLRLSQGPLQTGAWPQNKPKGFPPWVGCREKESALKREFPPFPGTFPFPPLMVLFVCFCCSTRWFLFSVLDLERFSLWKDLFLYFTLSGA